MNELKIEKIPNEYMLEVNTLIKENSSETAVLFLRFPTPRFKDDFERNRIYELLRLQSDGLPPVM